MHQVKSPYQGTLHYQCMPNINNIVYVRVYQTLMNLLQNHVALWNGKKLEVYVISQDKSTVRDAGEWQLVHCVVSEYCVQYYNRCMYNNLCKHVSHFANFSPVVYTYK